MRSTKKTITILCRLKGQPIARKIRADVYPCGLAIHPARARSSIYTVTHVPTGYGVESYIESRKTAQAIVAAIAGLIDWNSIKTLAQWEAVSREQKVLIHTTMERIERESQRKETP
jgi:hypothetical protein